jgi:hypothetical protein
MIIDVLKDEIDSFFSDYLGQQWHCPNPENHEKTIDAHNFPHPALSGMMYKVVTSGMMDGTVFIR